MHKPVVTYLNLACFVHDFNTVYLILYIPIFFLFILDFLQDPIVDLEEEKIAAKLRSQYFMHNPVVAYLNLGFHIDFSMADGHQIL